MSDNVKIPKSFLMSGKDFQITKSLKVKHPTVQEVLNIDNQRNGFYSEEIYYSYVSIFICDPYDYMVYLDDKGLDYESIKPFELFIMLLKETLNKYSELSETHEDFQEIFMNNIYFKAFSFFLGTNNFILAKDENEKIVLADPDTMTVIFNSKTFQLCSTFIREINGIHFSNRINPEDEFAKKILIEDERSRLKKKYKNQTDDNVDRLGSLLSSITWACNGGINTFNRGQLHMYDLVDGVQRTDKLLNFNNTMTGYYSGCIDKKHIDFNKLSWQN